MKAWSPTQKKLVEILLVGVILILALLIANIPRWNYSYPIHSDEWTGYGDAQSLMGTEKISYPDPMEAGALFSPDVEIGFHLFLGEIKHITGMSWLNIFYFLPGIILALLAFQIYAMTRRKWIGLLSALLVVLIPTTIRFLGPAFLVPVALGLTFIPLTLLILRRFMHDLRGPVILLFSLFSLLFIHPPTFIIVSLIALIHLVFNLFPGKEATSQRRLVVLSLCGICVIYIFGFFWGASYISFNFKEALIPQSEQLLPPIIDIVSKFGYIPPFIFALGIGILAYKGQLNSWALVLSAVGLLAFQMLYTYSYIGPDIIYERGWLYLYVLMAIIGGMTLGDIWQWLQNLLQSRPFMAVIASYVTIIVLLATSFGLSLRSHVDEPYYHLVDDATYQDFLWVGEYVPPTHQTGITDIGIACPFAAVSGKNVYIGEVSPHFRLKESQAGEFLNNKAADTKWLNQEGLSIVYTSGQVKNNALNKVNRNLYLLIEGLED